MERRRRTCFVGRYRERKDTYITDRLRQEYTSFAIYQRLNDIQPYEGFNMHCASMILLKNISAFAEQLPSSMRLESFSND